MKRTILIAVAIMLLGFSGATAQNFILNSAVKTPGEDTVVLSYTPTVSCPLFWRVLVYNNPGCTGIGSVGPLQIVAPGIITIPVSGTDTIASWLKIASWTVDTLSGLDVPDTTLAIAMEKRPSNSGTAYGKMDSVYFTININDGNGVGIRTYLSFFYDAACTYGFPCYTYTTSGGGTHTFSGVVNAFVDPCNLYYLQVLTSNPETGDFTTVIPVNTKCFELNALSASSYKHHISYKLEYGSVLGDNLTFTTTFMRSGSVAGTISFAGLTGMNMTIDTGISSCIPGLYSIFTFGYNSMGLPVYTDTLYVNVIGDYTGIEEIAQENKNPGAVSLYSMDGRLLKTSEGVLEDVIRDIKSSKEFPTGIYLVKFVSEGETFVAKLPLN